MSSYLRWLAAVLLIGGLVTCALAWHAAYNDRAFYTTAAALERHPDHILYQAEYHAALARHVAYILTAVVSGLGSLIGSAMLFGLSAVLRRLDRPQPARIA